MTIDEIERLDFGRPPKELLEFVRRFVVDTWPRWVPDPELQPIGDGIQISHNGVTVEARLS